MKHYSFNKEFPEKRKKMREDIKMKMQEDLKNKPASMEKEKRCCNCKWAGVAFKVVGKTHYYCGNEKEYPPEKMKSGEQDPIEALKEFWETCSSHEFYV